MTDDLLLVDGIQHTLHGCLHVLDRLIDDLVETNVNALSLRRRLRHGVRTHVEADDNGIGCACKHHVGLVDGTNAAVNALNDYFIIRELEQRSLHGLHATLNVSLDDQIQLLQITFLDLREQIIQGHLALGLLEHLLLVLCKISIRIALGRLIAVMRKEYLACARHVGKTQDLYGRGRTSLLHASALIVHHCSHLTVSGTCGDKVSHVKRTLLYQNGCHGTAALIQLCLDHKTSCASVGICLQLQDISGQQDRLQQILNALARLCRHGNKLRISAPVSCNQLILGQLLLYALNVCGGLINLIHGNNDLDAGCLCMVNRLNGLRHYAVVRCHHKDCNIRSVRAAHTHGGEGFMSGRIQEGDVTAVQRNGICTDVLRDAAGLALGYVRLTDRIQQGSLTVVNVTHNADYGRSLLQILLVLLVLLQELLDDVNLHFLLAKDLIIHRERLSLFIRNLLVQGHNLPFHKELLDQRCGLLLHLIRKILDGNGLGKGDHLDHFLHRFLFLLLRLYEAAGLILCCLVLLIHVILLISLILLLGEPSLVLLALLFHVLCGRGITAEGRLSGSAVTTAELTSLTGSPLSRSALSVTTKAALTAETAAAAVTTSALILTGSALTVTIIAALAITIITTLTLALTIVAALAFARIAALTLALTIVATLTFTSIATLALTLTIIAALALSRRELPCGTRLAALRRIRPGLTALRTSLLRRAGLHGRSGLHRLCGSLRCRSHCCRSLLHGCLTCLYLFLLLRYRIHALLLLRVTRNHLHRRRRRRRCQRLNGRAGSGLSRPAVIIVIARSHIVSALTLRTTLLRTIPGTLTLLAAETLLIIHDNDRLFLLRRHGLLRISLSAALCIAFPCVRGLCSAGLLRLLLSGSFRLLCLGNLLCGLFLLLRLRSFRLLCGLYGSLRLCRLLLLLGLLRLLCRLLLSGSFRLLCLGSLCLCGLCSLRSERSPYHLLLRSIQTTRRRLPLNPLIRKELKDLFIFLL